MIENKYPDGTTYVNSTKLGQQVFRLNSYADIWKLKQFVDAFHSEYDKPTQKINPNIIIPNLIDAQADRRFNIGESFGLKLVLQELANMDANFSIFHPHNPEVVEMAFEVLGSKVDIIDNSQFMSEVLMRNTDRYNRENVILMSSDAGGFKPLMKLCDKLRWKGETYSAAKSRKYEGRRSKITQLIDRQDFEGKHVIIVDDISVFGGTFKGLATLLRERNVGQLDLAVSHMTMQNLGDDPVTDYFDNVYTTNSKFDEYYANVLQTDGMIPTSEIKNLEIIKLF